MIREVYTATSWSRATYFFMYINKKYIETTDITSEFFLVCAVESFVYNKRKKIGRICRIRLYIKKELRKQPMSIFLCKNPNIYLVSKTTLNNDKFFVKKKKLQMKREV